MEHGGLHHTNQPIVYHDYNNDNKVTWVFGCSPSLLQVYVLLQQIIISHASHQLAGSFTQSNNHSIIL
jgi:hypothetical protein